jgi:hypothetical protein
MPRQYTGNRNMQKILKTALVASTAFLALTPAPLFAQTAQTSPAAETTPNTDSKSATGSLRFSTGISYSKGSYGEIEDTEVFAIPASLTYKKGPLKIRVSVPWAKINGPGSLISTPEGRESSFSSNSGSGSSSSGSGSSNSGSGSSGSGSGSSGSGSSGSGSSGSGSSGSGSSGSGSSGSGSSGSSGGGTITTGGTAAPLLNNKRSGFGDVNVALTYSIDLGGDFYFEPTAKVKLPTASRAKRLGTGEVDFTLSADLVKDVGNASFYVNGRRKFAGKPTGSTIRSTWGASAGASVRAADGFTLGADYDWQQSTFAGRKASSEVTGWANLRLADGLGLTLFASTGLNSNSADFATGATVSFRF